MFDFCLFLSILCLLSFAIYGLCAVIQWYASGKQTDIKKSFPKLKAMLGTGCLVFILGVTVSDSTMRALLDNVFMFCVGVGAFFALIIYFFPLLIFFRTPPSLSNESEDTYERPSRHNESCRNIVNESEGDVRVSDLNKRYKDGNP